MMVSLRVDVAFAVATYSCLTLAVMGEEWGSVLVIALAALFSETYRYLQNSCDQT